jgi:hypothetical protein
MSNVQGTDGPTGRVLPEQGRAAEIAVRAGEDEIVVETEEEEN